MKTPICNLCVKSGVLCSGCEDKLGKGKISQLDVDVSRTLNALSTRFNLDAAEFAKAIDLGRVILILTRGEVGVLIGKEGKVVSELSQTLGKKVRIAEISGDMRKTISDVVMPAKLVGINTIFREGERTYKVRLLRSEIRALPVDINTLEKALYSLLDAKVNIVFE
ncbi:MAG: KH domain-containing protein [Candidatus Micrarchaeota archaeon]